MNNRREFLKTASCAPGVLQAADTRPNILILMTDQQRAGFTRASGFLLDTMPALDDLAARGVSFERAHHGLNPRDPEDANGDRNHDGYTNIEEYLNWLAGKPAPVVKPRPRNTKSP